MTLTLDLHFKNANWFKILSYFTLVKTKIRSKLLLDQFEFVSIDRATPAGTRHRTDIMTSHGRLFDVVMTSCACWNIESFTTDKQYSEINAKLRQLDSSFIQSTKNTGGEDTT